MTMTYLGTPKGYAKRCADRSGYLTPAGKLPSVTTIVGETKSDQAKKTLENWKARQREQLKDLPGRTRKILENGAAHRGTYTHTQAENWIVQRQPDLSADLPGVAQASDLPGVAQRIAWGGYWKSLKGYLEANFHSALAIEKPIWHPAGFSGTFDCLGWTYDSTNVALFDWKTRGSNTKRLDPEGEQVRNYMVQLAAYRAGIAWTYDIAVNEAHLVIAYYNQEPHAIRLDKGLLDDCEAEFFDRLLRYQAEVAHVVA
jgi:ATP-dependent exoDNAse (exonuclease V) beta subunit